jgi:hypothetical protein
MMISSEIENVLPSERQQCQYRSDNTTEERGHDPVCGVATLLGQQLETWQSSTQRQILQLCQSVRAIFPGPSRQTQHSEQGIYSVMCVKLPVFAADGEGLGNLIVIFFIMNI